MYVKVLRHVNGEVSIYECDTVHHIKIDDLDEGEGKTMLVLNLESENSGSIHLTFVEKKGDSATIYLMNNEGKTFDTILWKIGK